MSGKALTTAAVVFAAGMFIFTAGCATSAPSSTRYEDGTYRGIFADKESIQVNVEFTLENGIVTAATFRHLRADENYHLETETHPHRQVIRQYQEALDYLVGKDLQRHLGHLYRPENVVETQVDGYSGATIRSGKVISAIRDGLNRGVYSY